MGEFIDLLFPRISALLGRYIGRRPRQIRWNCCGERCVFSLSCCDRVEDLLLAKSIGQRSHCGFVPRCFPDLKQPALTRHALPTYLNSTFYPLCLQTMNQIGLYKKGLGIRVPLLYNCHGLNTSCMQAMNFPLFTFSSLQKLKSSQLKYFVCHQ